MDTYDTTVNILKCYAALIVFVCHVHIICKEAFNFQFTSPWQFILKTPAWAGVWVFMIVAGFLAADGFLSGKYDLTKKWILSYYKNRLLKVLVPTWIMISLVYILADPQLVPGKTVIEYITCMFRGSGGASGVGATWYVFSIAWLYLLTPLFVALIRWIDNRPNRKKIYYVVFAALLVFGLAYRIVGRKRGLTWYRWIYASPIGNLDLFFGGMIVKRLKETIRIEGKKSREVVLLILLFILMLACSYMYFYGETIRPALLSIYRYIMPTAFLVIVGGVLLNSREKAQLGHFDSVMRTGAAYSFQFYLWHSLILEHVAKVIMIIDSFTRYLIVMVIGGILTAYIAYLMNTMKSALGRKR